ncbi:uncharacterized protein LOC131232569 [Magnolia sinica]|uniref:uncharacterized protein LOC131232569 n=1 Tax=Magnolia sinica TaxID=86752 RepID=UPI00265AEFD0|nr:uncharacterized protein LOC131232569 [Magnolia sinica]
MDFSSGMGSARSSSSSGWLESDCASDSVQSWSGSSEYSGENEGLDGKKDIQRSSRKRGVGDDSMETATCRRGPKVEEADKRGGAGSYEEKDQLSPVSVLDLHPYEDEESPSSNLPNTKRTKKKIHHKLGRFGIISQLGPINLDKQIYQTELEEEEDEDMKATDKAYDLLKILKARHGEVKKGTGVDRLMLDFFREGLVESKTKRSMRVKEEEELLRTAGHWMNLEGGRGLGVEDNKVAYVKGMEESGRWREFGTEEKEVAVEVETHVFRSLLDELLLDLLSP